VTFDRHLYKVSRMSLPKLRDVTDDDRDPATALRSHPPGSDTSAAERRECRSPGFMFAVIERRPAGEIQRVLAGDWVALPRGVS
jgi:hypothetical protein